MPATSTLNSPLEAIQFRRRDCEMPMHCCIGCLIGQIKLTRIHVALLFLPGVRVKRDKRPSLYDVERSGHCSHKVRQTSKLVSYHATYGIHVSSIAGSSQKSNGGA
jgi:hypothetical protein